MKNVDVNLGISIKVSGENFGPFLKSLKNYGKARVVTLYNSVYIALDV